MLGASYVNGAGKRVATMSADFFAGRDEQHDDEIQRGDLTRILYEATRQDVEYVFDDAITSVTERPDGVLVTFERAEPRVFDVVVGADGLHSGVRRLVFGEESRFVRHLGAYISIFPVEFDHSADRWELLHSTSGRSVCVYRTATDPVARTWLVFASEPLAYDRGDNAAQQAILADRFAGAGWQVPRLLRSMADAPEFYFDAMAQVHMDSWSHGRTVLVGEAGYCASPASGQGTALALVGAYVLAGELAAAAGDHRTAFARYEQRMRGFVELNQAFGRRAVKQFTMSNRAAIWFQTTMIRILPHVPWKNLVVGSILRDLKAAANGITLCDYDTVSAGR